MCSSIPTQNEGLARCSEFFFRCWIFAILQKIFWKNKNKNLSPVHFFLEKKSSKYEFLKLKKNHPKSQQSPTIMERSLRFFLLSYFECCQIWQYICTGHQLSNITKLKNKILARWIWIIIGLWFVNHHCLKTNLLEIICGFNKKGDIYIYIYIYMYVCIPIEICPYFRRKKRKKTFKFQQIDKKCIALWVRWFILICL
jgi:hypothetical protein